LRVLRQLSANVASRLRARPSRVRGFAENIRIVAAPPGH
jgi:hypothetical protein